MLSIAWRLLHLLLLPINYHNFVRQYVSLHWIQKYFFICLLFDYGCAILCEKYFMMFSMAAKMLPLDNCISCFSWQDVSMAVSCVSLRPYHLDLLSLVACNMFAFCLRLTGLHLLLVRFEDIYILAAVAAIILADKCFADWLVCVCVCVSYN